jgi:hypothetical protein
MNGQITYRQEGRTANIGFAKWRVQCFYDSFVQGSSSVFQMNICAKNPPLRKAENRCVSFCAKTGKPKTVH